jgi:hypothetical protein
MNSWVEGSENLACKINDQGIKEKELSFLTGDFLG